MDLRIALIGYGLAGSTFHAPVIDAVPGLRVTAVVARSQERAAAARAARPGVEVLASADEVFASPGRWDAVVVATPNRTHAALAESLARAGLPVVVDKPLTATAAEGEALVRLRGAGAALGVPEPALGLATSAPRGGSSRTAHSAGAAVRVAVRAVAAGAEGGWRESDDPADAGGLLYDLGSHLVDQALQLLGPATEVYAEVHSRRAGIQVDDDVFVALRHAVTPGRTCG